MDGSPDDKRLLSAALQEIAHDGDEDGSTLDALIEREGKNILKQVRGLHIINPIFVTTVSICVLSNFFFRGWESTATVFSTWSSSAPLPGLLPRVD